MVVLLLAVALAVGLGGVPFGSMAAQADESFQSYDQQDPDLDEDDSGDTGQSGDQNAQSGAGVDTVETSGARKLNLATTAAGGGAVNIYPKLVFQSIGAAKQQSIGLTFSGDVVFWGRLGDEAVPVPTRIDVSTQLVEVGATDGQLIAITQDDRSLVVIKTSPGLDGQILAEVLPTTSPIVGDQGGEQCHGPYSQMWDGKPVDDLGRICTLITDEVAGTVIAVPKFLSDGVPAHTRSVVTAEDRRLYLDGDGNLWRDSTDGDTDPVDLGAHWEGKPIVALVPDGNEPRGLVVPKGGTIWEVPLPADEGAPQLAEGFPADLVITSLWSTSSPNLNLALTTTGKILSVLTGPLTPDSPAAALTGDIGDLNREVKAVPTSEPDETDDPHILRLAVGEDHALALAEDGTVFAWGNNAWGQLGASDVGTDGTSSLTPAGLAPGSDLTLGKHKLVADGLSAVLPRHAPGTIPLSFSWEDEEYELGHVTYYLDPSSRTVGLSQRAEGGQVCTEFELSVPADQLLLTSGTEIAVVSSPGLLVATDPDQENWYDHTPITVDSDGKATVWVKGDVHTSGSLRVTASTADVDWSSGTAPQVSVTVGAARKSVVTLILIAILGVLVVTAGGTYAVLRFTRHR